MQTFQDIGLREHCVFELDLGIAALEFVADLGVAHKGAAGNQRLQLADQNVVLFQFFKLRNGHVIALDEVLVFFLTDEFAVGKQHGAELPVLKFLAQFVIADAQAHAVCFAQPALFR